MAGLAEEVPFLLLLIPLLGCDKSGLENVGRFFSCRVASPDASQWHVMDLGESLQTSSAWKRVWAASRVSWRPGPKPGFAGHSSRDSDLMHMGENLHV